MKRCLFEDQLKSRRPRPCAMCKKRKGPWCAKPMETNSLCEWWVAEKDNGSQVIFRCFPTSKDNLPRTPKARYDYLRIEYETSQKSALATVVHRYRDKFDRGWLWEFPAMNGLFASLFSGKVIGYRHATVCEVMSWMSSHTDDYQALEDREGLLVAMEAYV